MVPVYDAAHSTDAHLMKNLLEQAGIASYIRGEYLQGGLGDIPVSGMMQVCVDAADVERARAIIDEWNRGVVPIADEAPEDPVESIAVPEDAAGKPGFGRILFAGLFGAALGAGLMWAGLRGPGTEYALDYNGDGVVDDRFFYSGDVLERIEADRNHDGKVDQITMYGANGNAVSADADNDFDGRMEVRARYLHGQWLGEEADRNGDGAADYRADGVSGVIFSEQWLDAEGRTVKRVQYKNGMPVTSEIDTDKDGVLDTRRTYDRIGEITRGEKL